MFPCLFALLVRLFGPMQQLRYCLCHACPFLYYLPANEGPVVTGFGGLVAVKLGGSDSKPLGADTVASL